MGTAGLISAWPGRQTAASGYRPSKLGLPGQRLTAAPSRIGQTRHSATTEDREAGTPQLGPS
jgi:hypothetical protein